MTAMSISMLAKSGGVGVETVRYYQRRGLLDAPAPADRPYGHGIRHYGEADARRLRFIRAAQKSGFTLSEIGELLALDASDDRARARAMARQRIAALDAEIEGLNIARRALSRLARECAAGETGPCPILTAFDVG